MQAGSTRKEEVLLRLGEPGRAWKDQRNFLYLWRVVIGYVHWVEIGGGIRTDPVSKTYLLLIEFDEKDIVKRYDIKSKKGHILFIAPSVVDEINAW